LESFYLPNIRKLVNHFNGNRRKAGAVFALLAIGIAVFVFNNTYLFFVKDESTYFYPRLIMRFIVSFVWFLAAVIGTQYNRTKRNVLLMPALVLYLVGDIVVMYSIPVSAAFYGCGHLFFIASIMETTYLHRFQHVVTGLLMIVVVAIMVWYCKEINAVAIAGIVYGFICVEAMSSSLTNRFFCMAGIIFLVSDIAGFARVAVMNNKVTYVITTFIYYLSIYLLSVSVFNDSKKQVVTWTDLIRIFRGFENKNLRVWLAGKWGMGIILKKRAFTYRQMDLAYDTADEDNFKKWLEENKYEALDAGIQPADGGTASAGTEANPNSDYTGNAISENPAVNQTGKLAAGHYYSEKFGNLTVLPLIFKADGSAILVSEHGKELEMDAEYFKDTLVLRRRIYCLAPGGKELIRDAAGKLFTD